MTVVEIADMGGCRRPAPADADPPQQVGTGGRGCAPQCIREEPAISQQQHPGAQLLQQRLGQHGLTVAIRPDLRGEHRMRAALGQPHQPRLRERRLLTLVHPGTPEIPVIGRRVGHVQTRPVDGDHPPPRQPHPGSAWPAQRGRDPPEQPLQRC